MDINSTLLSFTESSLEHQIKKTLKHSCKNERPSKRAISTIMGFAASYDCVDTKIGKVELFLN